MNILCVSQTYPSKQYPTKVVFVHEQVKALREAGHNVVVVDVDLRSYKWKRRFGIYKESYDGITVYRASYPVGVTKITPMPFIKSFSEAVGKKVYKKFLKNQDFDCIFAHFAFEAGHAASAIKKKTHIPFIVLEHSSEFIRSGRSLSVLGEVYASADRVCAVSDFLAEKVSEKFPVQVSVLSNLIDSNSFQIKEDYKKNEEFTIISVGRLIKWKQFDLLVDAFAEFHKKVPSSKLVIVGSGEESDALEGKIKLLGLQENAILLGAVENSKLPVLYNQSHVFALPSKGETFGVVYIEAMACGIPAVSTKCGGPESFIREHNGILVNDNTKEFSDALMTVYQNYDRYYAREISLDIINSFGAKSYVEKFEVMLKSIKESK